MSYLSRRSIVRFRFTAMAQEAEKDTLPASLRADCWAALIPCIRPTAIPLREWASYAAIAGAAPRAEHPAASATATLEASESLDAHRLCDVADSAFRDGPLIANGKDVLSTFYRTRHEAVVAWNLMESRATDLVPIAVDRPVAQIRGAIPSTSKLYQCVSRRLVEELLRSISSPLERNVYALVSDTHPVDWFADIDSSTVDVDNCSETEADERHRAMRKSLQTVLAYFGDALCRHFERNVTKGSELVATVEQSAVFSACDCRTAKLSFHLHMRISCVSASGKDPSKIPVAFPSIVALKQFMESVHEELTEACQRNDYPEGRAAASCILSTVDWGVYSRWRAMRLPYCVKALSIDAMLATAAGNPASRPASVRLAAYDAVEAALNSVAAVGARCNLNSICVGCQTGNQLLRTSFPGVAAVRPLIPVSGEGDSSELGALMQSLNVTVDPSICIDLALICRPSGAVVVGPRVHKRQRIEEGDTDVGEVAGPSGEHDVALTSTVDMQADSKDLPVGCFPSGRRVVITNQTTRRVVWEVLQNLHPTAFRQVLPEHLTIQFEDAGQRAYYVYQKRSRHCLLLNREHRQTFGQLYLTFASVKFRCYSNDCSRHPCWKCSWDNNSLAASIPSRCFRPLSELRSFLFPELTAEDLMARYPSWLLNLPAAATTSSGLACARTPTVTESIEQHRSRMDEEE